MKRILLMVLRCFIFLPSWFTKLCKLENTEKYDEATRYSFLHKIAPIAIKKGRIKIESHGLDLLPKENGYIMFPNHQGLFDALAFLQTHERPFGVVMKKEVMSNYFLRKFVNILQAEIIDREDVRQSMKVIMNMTKNVKAGRNYIIFPEGTRSRKGNQLLEFKGGSFKSAMNAQCPIVPVALIDSFKAFDTNSIEPLVVQIHYLKPLYYEDYKELKSVEIANLVQSRITEAIEKNAL